MNKYIITNLREWSVIIRTYIMLTLDSKIYYLIVLYIYIYINNRLTKVKKFPKGLKSLKPDDKKIPLLMAIVQKSFPVIEIKDFNLLIC